MRKYNPTKQPGMGGVLQAATCRLTQQSCSVYLVKTNESKTVSSSEKQK